MKKALYEWEYEQYRSKTRNQRKRSKAQIALWLSVAAWAVVVAAVAASKLRVAPAEDNSPPPVEVASETLEAAVTVIEEDLEIYHLEAIEFYPVPLDHDLQVHIIRTCDENGIDPAVVIAMIATESDFDPDTIGDGGDSYGLMQIQPKWHSERMERLGVTDLLNPLQNVTVGMDYLAELLDKYSLESALTAYNSGRPGESEYASKVMAYVEGLSNAR